MDEFNYHNIIKKVSAGFLDIQNEDWAWDIVFNFKLRRNETLAETTNREKSAEKFWLENTGISRQKRHTKFIMYTGNKRYKNMRADTNVLGNLRISYSNIILYQLILEILKKIKKIVLIEAFGRF